ncbi:MAG: PQQ-binding-like beta-propeller repeat protein [Limisphaerales bacterium]
MKIQCSCGAKYALDVSPEMAEMPVRFVCPACGRDSSDFVNNLVRQELGLSGPAAATPAAAPDAPPAQPAPQGRPLARVRIHSPPTTPAEAALGSSGAPVRCSKHPDQFTTDKCCICSKPICPKCMELFGYVCSPLCKGKAESQGVEIPVYGGQKSIMEARAWRRTGWVAGAVGALVIAVLGFWFWYEAFGSRPKTAWSVRFAEPAYSGQSAFCGKDQVVFLHGDTLARYDMKLNKEIWSCHLVDKKQIEAAVAKERKEMQAVIDKANSEHPDNVPKMPDPEKLQQSMQRAAAAALGLVVRGQNIWVLSPGKLTRYDQDTGNPVKEIAVPPRLGGLIPRGDELLDVDVETGKPIITHINLTTCESRTEEVSPPVAPLANAGMTNRADAEPSGRTAVASNDRSGRAGLPIGMPGKDAGKVMDPKKIAEQAQHLTYAAKIALPAILAHNMNQERTLAAYDDQPSGNTAPSAGSLTEGREDVSLIPAKDGFILFSVKLIESRITARAAMKPAPRKSVLNGNLTVGNTADLANEMLNEQQRSRGGEVVQEDESRYLVSIRRMDAPGAWSGEMIGPPTLYPLTTVNVLTANKTLLVLDKNNQTRWQSPLSYNVRGGLASLDPDHAPYGLGPCVERNGALYVYDEGVLAAFDLANGTVRWRLPSVGITGLFFDDQGMVYVNSTTAGPDAIKYSNQIDITRKASPVVMKVDPRTGKGLWTAELGGLVNYVSGKFIYAMSSYQPDDEGDSGFSTDAILGRESFLSIKRINPKNGHVMWEYPDRRVPLDVQFDQNSIRLVFKREVRVLRFLAL